MGPIDFYPYQEDSLIRKMRVQAWFKAVTIKSGLSARELEEKFREDSGRKVKRSCIWNKYRRGEVVPRAGYREDGRPNLLEQVEAHYPGTSGWLLSPIWRLADPVPMEMSEIRGVYAALPAPMRSLFIVPRTNREDRFWRSAVPAKKVHATLLCMRDFDAFVAALAMVREAETTQSRISYRNAVEMSVQLMAMFETRAEGSPCPLAESGLFGYLQEWWID